MRVIDADVLFSILHDKMKGAEEWRRISKNDAAVECSETAYVTLYNLKAELEDEVETIEEETIKHAKWVKVYGDHLSMGHRVWALACSKCDRLGDGTPFCPHCGAKMEGVTDGE